MQFYATNLPPHATGAELAALFAPIRGVTASLVWVVGHGPVGVLTLDDVSGRPPNLDGVWLRGRTLTVSPQPPWEQPAPERAARRRPAARR